MDELLNLLREFNEQHEQAMTGMRDAMAGMRDAFYKMSALNSTTEKLIARTEAVIEALEIAQATKSRRPDGQLVNTR